MKVAFFTEAGSKRGMGHLIRCQTIATELKRNDVEVDFFLDSDIDYRYIFDNLQYFEWSNFILQKTYDVIFIDSYEANLLIYKLISKSTKIPIYIDDYERLPYPKGIIINFAPNAKEIFFKNKNNSCLLGIDYIPIREIFFKHQKNKKDKKIFIMLGGSDTANLSQDILESLKEIDIKKVIVINNESTKNTLKKYQNIEILFKPNDEELIYQMSSSSYAISTASMTLYELAFLKIPTIIIAVSKNQLLGVSQMINNNLAAAYIDITKDNWKISINREIKRVIKSRIELNQKIDGLGTKRIYDYIIKRLEK